ncbi:MAG: Nudix hydrolase, partial [Halanaerobium sp.]
MNLLTLFYILNATLLILHEIESGYEREWKILKLPGEITSFLILHVPIIFVLFYGLLEVDQLSNFRFIMGLLTGLGGIIPFLVHKIFVKREERFNLLISNIIIYSNI